jgi:iron(II)-dependent oxidoreductase
MFIKTPLMILICFLPLLTCSREKNTASQWGNDHYQKNNMVLVPAGFFWRGSENGEIDEKPSGRLWIDSFYIDCFPVTNAQYAVYLAETGAPKPLYWNDGTCNSPGQPVVGVSWQEALSYCKWRSAKDSAVYTLPTEAQWEKAARGEDRRTYPWGNQPPTDKRAPTKISERMPEVGLCELGQSPYGVADMVGNVWNWCLDWYDKNYYKTMPARNPAGPSQGRRKVVRGGNWVFLGCCSGTPAYALRTTRRNAFHPHIRKKSIGFRCVKLFVPVGKSGSKDFDSTGTQSIP